MDEPVRVTLTKAEALVLFDLLADFRDQPTLLIRNNAERATLWNLAAGLEKTLAEPFSEHYQRPLDQARSLVERRASGSERRTKASNLNASPAQLRRSSRDV